MPDTTTVATVNHPQPQPSRHPQIADLPFREGPQNYVRAVLKRGGRATNADLANSVGVSTRTIQRRRRRLEADASFCAAGFRVEARFRGKWQITNQIILPPVADRRRCECMSGSESPALGVTHCHATYVREDQDQDQDRDQNKRARERATTATATTTKAVMPKRATTATTTTAVRTGGDSTGRDPGPACAPETPPPARRTPAKAKPATPRQLEYVAYLADEVGISPPNPSALNIRSAHRAIRGLVLRLGRLQSREMAAARREAHHHHSEDAVDWARERIGYAVSARCDSCGGIHWAEPGGVCSGCGKQMRRGVIPAAPDRDTAPDDPSATSTPGGSDTTAPRAPLP